MNVTRQSLSAYYETLNEHELRRMLDCGELTDIAQEVAAAELMRRGVTYARRNVEAQPLTLPPPSALDDQLLPPTGNGGRAELVFLARPPSLVEAELLLGRLRAEGIAAVIIDAPMLRPLGGTTRVLVPQSQLHAARLLLGSIERASPSADMLSRRGARPMGNVVAMMLGLAFFAAIVAIA